jgi:hypothetical protein
MDASQLVPYRGQVVDLMFGDGAHVRAHLLSVDPDVDQDQVFYEALSVVAEGEGHNWRDAAKAGFAASAHEIAAIVPTDGRSYTVAPGSRLFKG